MIFANRVGIVFMLLGIYAFIPATHDKNLLLLILSLLFMAVGTVALLYK